MAISIIIPALNEEKNIASCLEAIRQNAEGEEIEIIVVDGGSSDRTIESAKKAGNRVVTTAASRAIQMNEGAREAKKPIFVFPARRCYCSSGI